MKVNLNYVLIFILAFFLQKVCQAQVSLPKIFGNDMVQDFQQEMKME